MKNESPAPDTTPSTTSTSIEHPPPAHLKSFRKTLLAVLGLAFVVMMVALDQTIVGTALPTIVAELKGFDLYAWVATSYLLASVITVPIFGRLGDHFGRKYFVVAAIAVFTLASALCGMANSMLFLVLARGLQGIGGGMMVGTAFASIPDLFPESQMRLRWQVIISSSFGIANAIGPSLGGLMTEYIGWRSVFYVNLPVGLLGMYFVGRHMPFIRHHKGEGTMKLDWLGALLIAAALGSLQLFVELLPTHGFTVGMILIAATSIVAFIWLLFCEKRATNPILPLEMFRNPMLASLFTLAVLVGFMMFALIFYMPLLLQGGFGLAPDVAGLLMTPLVVCITVGSISNGRLLTRIPNPTWMLYAGFVLLGFSAVGIATLKQTTPHALMIFYMIGSGIGFGFVMPNLTIFAQESAGRSHLGIATAMVQSLRMVGGMLGTALVGTLVNHMYVSHVRSELEAAHATQWLTQLSDPQILVNKAAQIHLAAQQQALGQNSASLIESARTSLVSSIHVGQMLSILVTIIAVWQLRRLPRLQFRRKAEQRNST